MQFPLSHARCRLNCETSYTQTEQKLLFCVNIHVHTLTELVYMYTEETPFWVMFQYYYDAYIC